MERKIGEFYIFYFTDFLDGKKLNIFSTNFGWMKTIRGKHN